MSCHSVTDSRCINAAIRELQEEFKVFPSTHAGTEAIFHTLALKFGVFEDAFRNFSNTSIRFKLLNKTPVFIGVAQWIEDISRGGPQPTNQVRLLPAAAHRNFDTNALRRVSASPSSPPAATTTVTRCALLANKKLNSSIGFMSMLPTANTITRTAQNQSRDTL